MTCAPRNDASSRLQDMFYKSARLDVKHTDKRMTMRATRCKIRTLPLLALTALVLATFPAGRAAGPYPERPLRIVVPFAPGGGTDAIARTLAQEMAQDLGVSVVIENKPGAGTIIGTQAVAASAPDGYTLLMGTFSHAVNISLSAKLPYDPHKDFVPVALIARSSISSSSIRN